MDIAFSVDLEPNKDGSMMGVEEAMTWIDGVVPRSTVYATYRIARDAPDLLDGLAESNEIGVHVHPREFGHEHDQLVDLDPDRQRDLLDRTREAILDATGLAGDEVTAFRAGRHSADEETLAVVSELGFDVDASLHVRYDHVPESLRNHDRPFRHGDLLEIPTSWVRPRLLSRAGLRVFPARSVTATSTTLRQDDAICSGRRAMATLLDRSTFVSFYMHPYDATDYHATLQNAGRPFRRRVEDLFGRFSPDQFVTASEVRRTADP